MGENQSSSAMTFWGFVLSLGSRAPSAPPRLCVEFSFV
jgi:hypothetical protein